MALEYSFTPCDRNDKVVLKFETSSIPLQYIYIYIYTHTHMHMCIHIYTFELPCSWAVYRVSELTWAHTRDFCAVSILGLCPGCTCFAADSWPRDDESFRGDQEVRNLGKGKPTSCSCQRGHRESFRLVPLCVSLVVLLTVTATLFISD